jgi:hypothetical protein
MEILNIHSVKGVSLSKIKKLTYGYARNFSVETDTGTITFALFSDNQSDLETK